jgi:hypothetical protein
MASGTVSVLGTPTVSKALAAAFASGLSERLVVNAINSFAGRITPKT